MTDDFELTDRAREWVVGLNAHYQSEAPVASAVATAPGGHLFKLQ